MLRENPKQGGIIERWFKTTTNVALRRFKGYVKSRTKEHIEEAQKGACLKRRDLVRVLDGFFWSYNHEPYPKDKKLTRHQRWLKGLGNTLPEPIAEDELDICLMKEVHRRVGEHGSVSFAGETYRGVCLKPFEGKQVSLRIDPDHVLQLRAYTDEDETIERMGELIGYVNMINHEYQDLTLDELKGLGKGKQDPNNYASLLELGFRNKLSEERKRDKRSQQREEHKLARRDAKKPQNTKEHIIPLHKQKFVVVSNEVITQEVAALENTVEQASFTEKLHVEAQNVAEVKTSMNEQHQLVAAKPRGVAELKDD